MKVLFLDANILFSAAYRDNAGIAQLWYLPKVKLITSKYALEEARRNLKENTQHTRLNDLINLVEVIHCEDHNYSLPKNIKLQPKDRPILIAAIKAKANYLLTGDIRDFGAYFGQTIKGVTILPPAEYFRLINAKSNQKEQ